jgi:hypothetical protein
LFDVVAPKVFVSYVHESPQHQDDVLAFASFLRGQGVEAVLDVWAAGSRHEWYAWAIREMTDADYVIVVASPAYRAVGDGSAPPDRHRGVQSEATLLRELVYGDRATWTPKVLPVLLPGHEIDEIPRFLSPHTASRYVVGELTVAGAEDLLRVIHRRPGHVAPPIQPPPDLPPRPAPADGPVWCAAMPDVEHAAGSVEVHLVPGESPAYSPEELRRAVSEASTAQVAESDELVWAPGIAVLRTGQRSAWFPPPRDGLAAALEERIALLAGLGLPSPASWVPAAGAGTARFVLPRVAEVRPAELAARLAGDLAGKSPEARVSNVVSGNVTGTVIQAGDIHGGIHF